MPENHRTGRRCVIVGAGAMGLAMAELLARSGHQVTVLEAAPAIGGLTAQGELDLPDGRNPHFDRFYHVILTSDRRVRALVDRLGLGDRLQFATTAAELLAGGRVHPASSVVDLARLPSLRPVDRVRVAATIGAGAVLPLDERARRGTSADWLRRWSGASASQALWEPLLRAKLGTRSGQASAVFIRSTFRRLVGARLRGGVGDRFGTVEGGWSTILDAWARRCEQEGVRIHTGVPVSGLHRAGHGWMVESGAGRFEADDVVVTLAGPPAAALLGDAVPAGHRERLATMPYLGVICTVVALARPLTGGYLTYITDDVPFTGIVEISNLRPDPAFAGASIVYLPRYTDPSDPVFDADAGQVGADFVRALRAHYPGVSEQDVLGHTVYRARYVMPVPTPDQTAGAPPFATGAPGLWCVGSPQVTDGTLNVETTLRLAEQAAADVGAGTPDKPTLRILQPAQSGTPVKSHPDRPVASVSLDVDNLWSYLRTHGDPNWQTRPSYLTALAGRMREVFDAHAINPTVFVVGADAVTAEGRDFVAGMHERGCEIGNHSFEHEPWLHLYSPAELRAELSRTADAIEAAGAPRPTGFRAPGYSMSPDLVSALVEQGYDYDCSVLATWIGPAARFYYLRTNKDLSDDESTKRKALFGSAWDVALPNRPFVWSSTAGQLSELPVTVFPMARVPMHVSYVIHLAGLSPALAKAYVAASMRTCLLTRTAPSLLLHPLDLLDGADAPGLEFFPGMTMPYARKRAVLDLVLATMAEHFTLVGTGEHARASANGFRSRRDANLLRRGRAAT